MPHALSSIARQLLFRDVSLHLGSSNLNPRDRTIDPVEMGKWHARRSAEILCHLVSYPVCASQVRSLTVCATKATGNMLFSYFMGVLTLSIEFST